MYCVHCVCKDGNKIVDQFDDLENLVSTKKEAQKLKASWLDNLNADCKKGVWSARIKTL